jgi:hypothetical protein
MKTSIVQARRKAKMPCLLMGLVFGILVSPIVGLLVDSLIVGLGLGMVAGGAVAVALEAMDEEHPHS